MNKDLLESQWTQIREFLQKKFNNLTEEDIRQINGRYDQLVAKLQQKYGYTREEAEERIRSWNFDRFANTERIPPAKNPIVHEERVRKEEDYSSLLKWLFALCIPILLLAAYFLSPARLPQAPVPPAVNQEQAVAETPADRAISNNLREALIAQPNRASDLQNVQIATRNGVVTLSGTVPNQEARDFILNRAQNFAGVKQVINNIQIQ